MCKYYFIKIVFPLFLIQLRFLRDAFAASASLQKVLSLPPLGEGCKLII